MGSTRLKKISFKRRIDVLDMIYNAGTGHIGGSMSCMEILVCLYYEIMDIEKIREGLKERDRFILSKGHCAEALYSVLADLDFISKDSLGTFAGFDTMLAEHPIRKTPGVEVSTGSLGHGLSIGTGMAVGLKYDKSPAEVYVLAGDGEQAEGSNWEAAMSAGKYKLDNLILFIDRNRLQISGSTEDVMPLEDLAGKYRAFGWECRVCDGHDPESIIKASSNRLKDKPLVIIAETTKGYGSPVMENKAQWHHRIPNDAEYLRIKADLTAVVGAL